MRRGESASDKRKQEKVAHYNIAGHHYSYYLTIVVHTLFKITIMNTFFTVNFVSVLVINWVVIEVMGKY